MTHGLHNDFVQSQKSHIIGGINILTKFSKEHDINFSAKFCGEADLMQRSSDVNIPAKFCREMQGRLQKSLGLVGYVRKHSML